MKTTGLAVLSWITLLGSIPFISPTAMATSGGSGVGNGGGLWTCRDENTDETLRWAYLLDLSEGDRDWGVHIEREVSLDRAAWILRAEDRMAKANVEFYMAYLTRKAEVQARFALVPDSDFIGTEDFNLHTRPAQSTCPHGTIPLVPEQLANFTPQGQLIVNRTLWESPVLADIDRAALYLHEGIYKLLRETQGHTDSLKTRELVAYLFSNQPVSHYAHAFRLAPRANPENQATPHVPTPGRYTATVGDWSPIQINDFDATTERLYVTELKHDGSNRNSHTFKCKRQGLEYRCNMIQTTNWFIRTFTSVTRHRIRFTEPNTFVWYTQRSGGVRATRYSR